MVMKSMDEEFKFPDEEVANDAAEGKNEAGGETEVEIVDDTPPRDRNRKPLDGPVTEPTDEELASYSEGVKKRIKELTHARHDERRRAEALQRERDEALRVATTLMERTKAVETQFNTGAQQFAVVSKQAAQAAVEAAREQLKKAKEAYDTDAEMAANEALMDAKQKLRDAENFRPPAFQPVEEVVQIPQQSTADESVDNKTLSWQARNQWFGQRGNEDITSFALGYHQKLVNSGVDPRSDEYFEKVDKRLRQVFPDFFEDSPADQPPTRAKPTPVVSGASRAAAGPRKVQLTQSQVAIAQKLGLTPQQYAAELIKLEKSNG